MPAKLSIATLATLGDAEADLIFVKLEFGGLPTIPRFFRSIDHLKSVVTDESDGKNGIA